MARTRRRIISGQPYELILRVSDRIPFVALVLVKILLESAVARAQRDLKIVINHALWMGNHVHIILVPYDPQQCVNFYQELQKKITDSFKRLTGLDKLILWDGSAVLARILDPDEAVQKIAYAYANPAAANLVDRIEEYPGVSTYSEFLESANTVDAESVREVPYIRQTDIKPLRSLKVSEQEDRIYSAELRKNSRTMQKLIIKPNAWMRAFGIESEDDVAKYNRDILDTIKTQEQKARDKRALEKKKVLGAEHLRRCRIFQECISKKRERRVFFHSSCKELRLAFLAEFREFEAQCRRCYQLLKQGILAEWPPGAFRPPAPPLASALI